MNQDNVLHEHARRGDFGPRRLNEARPLRRKVFIVDDHPIVRQGLADLINQESDLAVCGEAEGVREARQAIGRAEPDVVILDLSLRDSDGLELIKDMRSKDRDLPVLVLSMHDESIYAERLLSAGANGYIMKQAAADQLLAALREVLDGRIYVSEKISANMIGRFAVRGQKQHSNPIDRLSNRELQVLNMIGRGKTTREIAEDLNLSVKTVESHRQRIKKKLDLTSPAQLVQFAVNWFAQKSF